MTTDLIAQHAAHVRGRWSARTAADRERLLRRVDRELPMGLYDATTEELEEWLAGPEETPDQAPWSRQTRATYYTHLVGFDPSIGLIRPRVPEGEPRPVSCEQLVLARNLLPQPWRLFVELAAFAGLRAVEISRLDREDVTKDQIYIRRGKGDKPRTVENDGVLWAAIQPMRAGPIARRASGLRMDPNDVSEQTSIQLSLIGLTDVTLHRFRHWYATYLLDEGAAATAVQKAMGHGSLKTTARYLDLTSRQRANLRRAVHALPALVPIPS